jgi:hypothetical protein
MANSVKDHFGGYMAAKHKVSSAGTGDGGACVKGPYNTKYTKNDSCSYRWQAVMAYSKKGKQSIDGRENRLVTPKATQVRTSRYETSKSKSRASGKKSFYPGDYPAALRIPDDPQGWCVGGPTKTLEVKDGPGGKVLFKIPAHKNFTSHLWPYWNNAHHIIPKGTLKSTIAELENPTGWPPKSPALRNIVERFLLKKLYNVNHHSNVILLPMDKEVAKILKLPRHLLLEDDDDVPMPLEEASPKFDHLLFNLQAQAQLIGIMDDFSSAAKKAAGGGGKTCVTDEMEAAEKKLRDLSDFLHDEILRVGAKKKGLPVSLAFSV